MKLNKDSKKYFREIKTIIPSRGTYEKRLLNTYKERISELHESRPDITYEELQKILGKPVEIINDYYENVDTVYLMKRLRTTKLVRMFLYVILFITLIGFALSVGINIQMYYAINNTIVNQKEIIIE